MTPPRLGFLRGVRFRLVALVIMPIIPIVAIVGWQTSQVRDRALEDATTDSLRLSRLAAENIGSLISQTRAVMRLAVRIDGGLFADPAACADALASDASTVTSITNAFVIGPNGDITCSVVPGIEGTSLADRAYIGDAFALGESTAGVEPVGDLVAAPTLIVTEPFGDSLLAAAIDLGDSLGGFVDTFALPAESTITLMDGAGVVVGRWPEQPAAIGQLIRLDDIAEQVAAGSVEGSSDRPGSDGVQRIYSYVDVVGSSQTLYAIVGVPRSWGVGPVYRELRTNVILLIALGLAGIGIALLLAERSIRRHLRDIGATMRRIGAGDLTARLGPRRAAAELSELAGSVDEMAADLEAREAALRSASAERARLVDELLDVQEDERRRIAADIHDDTIQTVVASAMSAQLLRNRLGDADARDQADQLATRLAAATSRLRQLTFDLDPAANGLSTAEGLERYLTGALDGRSMELLISADPALELQGPVRQVVFRNVREAALNAAEHGEAHRLVVTLEEDLGGLRVDVTDDGRGFTPDPRGWPGHQGVRTMRHRVEALGGWFELVPVAGGGARVSFWLPFAVDDQLQPAHAPAPVPEVGMGMGMVGVG